MDERELIAFFSGGLIVIAAVWIGSALADWHLRRRPKTNKIKPVRPWPPPLGLAAGPWQPGPAPHDGYFRIILYEDGYPWFSAWVEGTGLELEPEWWADVYRPDGTRIHVDEIGFDKEAAERLTKEINS